MIGYIYVTLKYIEGNIYNGKYLFNDVPYFISDDLNKQYFSIIEILSNITFVHDVLIATKIKIIKILSKEELFKKCINAGKQIFNVCSGEYHFKNGLLHRDNDLPAIIMWNHTKKWYINGKHHRDNDQPATIFFTNNREWIKNDICCRDNDLPSQIFNTSQYWCKNNLWHRDNDLPAIISYDGRHEWLKNGKYYRENDLRYIIKSKNY